MLSEVLDNLEEVKEQFTCLQRRLADERRITEQLTDEVKANEQRLFELNVVLFSLTSPQVKEIAINQFDMTEEDFSPSEDLRQFIQTVRGAIEEYKDHKICSSEAMERIIAAYK